MLKILKCVAITFVVVYIFAAIVTLKASGELNSSGEQDFAVVTHSLTVQERLETIETIDVTAYKEADTTDEESVDEEVGDILAEAEDAETESEEVSDEKES